MKRNQRLLATLGAALSTAAAIAGEPQKSAPAIAVAAAAVTDPATPVSAGPQPFVGLVTSEAPAAVAAQLGLPSGFGLLVEEVLPESPAAAAGFQSYDVLKTLDDQQLVNPGQLSTLVRAAGKDKEVSFTILRKGQEQHLKVKVGERAMPDWTAWRPKGSLEGPFANAFAGDELARDRAASIAGEVKKLKDSAREKADQARRGAEEMEARIRKELDRTGISPAEILREARPEGGAKIKRVNKDGVTIVDGSKAQMSISDADGTIEVTVNDGRRTLVARDATGKEVFSGPVDTEEQRQAVPKQFRKKLEQVKIKDEPTADGQSSSVTISKGSLPAPGPGRESQ